MHSVIVPFINECVTSAHSLSLLELCGTEALAEEFPALLLSRWCQELQLWDRASNRALLSFGHKGKCTELLQKPLKRALHEAQVSPSRCCSRALQPALSQLSRRRVWLSVTVLVEKVSVVALSSAGSVLECAAVELLRSLAQREWPVLIPSRAGLVTGRTIHTLAPPHGYYPLLACRGGSNTAGLEPDPGLLSEMLPGRSEWMVTSNTMLQHACLPGRSSK
ncbi:hypothetical protein EPR50_G00110320 [Perca flavescens]|uniref:Uncharacterized protein n=1 Tax=Perca flavescens TaxID=8167 RepID=A0A484CYY6_PERFV|nr:hypothetical protein EPR50_G00110320 [Perca flavescens]